MRFNDVVCQARERTLYLEKDGHLVHTCGSFKPFMYISIIRHKEFSAYIKSFYTLKRDRPNMEWVLIFAASLNEINKMLATKKKFTRKEIPDKLPSQLHHYCQAFEPDKDDASDLPPHRPGIDITIEIEKDNQG